MLGEALAPPMAPRKGWAGRPGCAPGPWAVTDPPPPPRPRCPRGKERAQPEPRAASSASPGKRRKGSRGVVFLSSGLALSSLNTEPEDAKESLFNSPPTTAAQLRLIYFLQLCVPGRREREKPLFRRQRPGSSPAGRVAQVEWAPRAPLPVSGLLGCWVWGTSSDPDCVLLGRRTVPLSLPEPLQNPGRNT